MRCLWSEFLIMPLFCCSNLVGTGHRFELSDKFLVFYYKLFAFKPYGINHVQVSCTVASSTLKCIPYRYTSLLIVVLLIKLDHRYFIDVDDTGETCLMPHRYCRCQYYISVHWCHWHQWGINLVTQWVFKKKIQNGKQHKIVIREDRKLSLKIFF